jgi:hypothetical protein
MGMFDNEGIGLTLDSTPEESPVTETATPTTDGHVEKKAPETQAPVTSAEVKTEVPATQTEVKIDTTTQEKLLANRFKTEGELIHGIMEAAELTGTPIDWKTLNNTEDREGFYNGLRQKIGRGEIRNVAPSTPQTIQTQVQTQQATLDQELQKIIQTSNQVLQETAEPEEDFTEFAERFEIDPVEALRERDAKREARLTKQFEARLNLEAVKLTQLLQQSGVLNMAQHNQDQTAWNDAKLKVENIISQHGDNDLEEYANDIFEHIKANPQMLDLVYKMPGEKGLREQVILDAYGKVKLQKQLGKLAKVTSEQDTATIEASKTGLSIQTGVGGNKLEPKSGDEQLIDNIFGGGGARKGMFG